MADTIRTRATLLASLFQDAQVAGISPQDMRDLIVSQRGVYGSMSVDSPAGAANTSIQTTFVLLDFWDTVGPGAGVAVEVDSNYDMDVNSGGDGIFRLHFTMCFTGTTSTDYTGRFFKNGVETDFGFRLETGATAGIASVSAHGFISLVAGDLITFKVKADGATKALTAHTAVMSIERVA